MHMIQALFYHITFEQFIENCIKASSESSEYCHENNLTLNATKTTFMAVSPEKYVPMTLFTHQ